MKDITEKIIQNSIRNNKFSLSSTHTKLCIPIINRIYKKMSAGIKFLGIKVDKGAICDGHHRYIASIVAEKELETIMTNSTSATIDWLGISDFCGGRLGFTR